MQSSACNFIKKEALVQTFSCEFCEKFWNTYFFEHLQTGFSKCNKSVCLYKFIDFPNLSLIVGIFEKTPRPFYWILLTLLFNQYFNQHCMQSYSANNYMFKINNRNTRKNCEICSELTIKIPEWHQWRRSDVFTVNSEHISHLFLVLLLLTLNR